MLDGAGVLDDYPELAERWDELNEALDEDGSIEQLVEQIEERPRGLWLALQGLGRGRARGSAGDRRRAWPRGPLGPGLVEFLRLLAYCHDPATRAAALDALGRGRPSRRRLA